MHEDCCLAVHDVVSFEVVSVEMLLLVLEVSMLIEELKDVLSALLLARVAVTSIKG